MLGKGAGLLLAARQAWLLCVHVLIQASCEPGGGPERGRAKIKPRRLHPEACVPSPPPDTLRISVSDITHTCRCPGRDSKAHILPLMRSPTGHRRRPDSPRLQHPLRVRVSPKSLTLKDRFEVHGAGLLFSCSPLCDIATATCYLNGDRVTSVRLCERRGPSFLTLPLSCQRLPGVCVGTGEGDLSSHPLPFKALSSTFFLDHGPLFSCPMRLYPLTCPPHLPPSS